MQLQYLHIDKYKNLNDFTWNISEMESSHIICIIGQNAAGKSNLLEAIVHIFSCLQYSQSETSLFDFEIIYKIDYSIIRILGKKNNKTGYKVYIDGEEVPLERIQEGSSTWMYPKHSEKLEGILPENIIVYYSGYSRRMKEYFLKVDADYAKIFREGTSKNLPPLLLIQPVHFKMILLALFSFEKSFSSIYKDFLLKYFNIEEITSFSIQVKKHTNWVRDNTYSNFFDTKGIIRAYFEKLDELQKKENEELEISEIEKGPFKIGAKNNQLLINTVVYFFRKHESLIKLKEAFGFEADVFKVLNVLNQSGYLHQITVNIKKKGVEGEISFDELSEGEQQLLAIKGCIELLWGKNNLFLWDEPDTFLNPRWQWNLLPDLEKQIGDRIQNQFILTTHSPVLLSTIKKGVYEMENGALSAVYNTYGLTVNEALVKQDINTQIGDVTKLYDDYLSLVQQGLGRSEEAVEFRRQLESIWGANHEDLLKANVYLKYYE